MGPAHQGGRHFCGLMVVKGPNRAGRNQQSSRSSPFFLAVPGVRVFS